MNENSMIKICHLSSMHACLDTRIFYKECKSLAKKYEVHLVIKNDKDELVDGVYIRGLTVGSESRWVRMTCVVYQTLKKALEIDADIYHFHDPELIPAGLYLKFKGKKVIYDVHEDYSKQILSKYWLPKYSRKIVSFSLKQLESVSSRFFDGIVVATERIMENFKVNNVICVNNYPLLEEFCFDSSDWGKKKKCICYVGSISEVRGIKEIVQATGNTDLRLKLAGAFSPSTLLDKVKGLRGWGQTDFLGFLRRDEVQKVLSSSIVGMVVLHPIENYIESKPVKMYEYMAMGIPIIASDFPEWVKIVEENHCGICVNPLDICQITEAIDRITADMNLAEEMGKNGRKLIENEYNWSIEEKKLFDLYEKILG